jgi:transposase
MNVNLVAIDLAKESFHVRAVNHTGRVFFDSKVRREGLLQKVLNFPTSAVIVMEACASAHHWGRKFREFGYVVKLIAPQFVKPFVKSQKNDRADAEAIAEAASRSSMRFVAIKSVAQQEIQSIHRIRSRLIKNLTQLTNEIRGLLGEFGIIVAQGISTLRRRIPELLEDVTLELPDGMRSAIADLYEEILLLEKRVVRYTQELTRIAKQNPICQRLQSIPGISTITATALIASVGDPSAFKNGRCFAAALGLVPQQSSTGGKSKLGRITKRGDSYLRQLLVHGARSVIKVAHRYNDPYRLWVTKLRERSCYNKAAVALANRNARIAWVLLTQDLVFSPQKVGKSELALAA